MSRDRNNDSRLEVLRGRVQSLSLYEITADELAILESAPSNGTYLNVAIALLSTGASLAVALMTATFASDRRFYVFVIATLVSFVAGLILLLVWWKTKSSITNVLQRIRARVPRRDDEGGDEPDTASAEG